MNFLNIDQIVEFLDKLTGNFSFRCQSLIATFLTLIVTHYIYNNVVNSFSYASYFDFFKPMLLLLILFIPILWILLTVLEIKSFSNNKSLFFHLMFFLFIAVSTVGFESWEFSRSSKVICEGVSESVKITSTDLNRIVALVSVVSQCEDFKGSIQFSIPIEAGRKLDPGIEFTYIKNRSPMGIVFFEAPNPLVN